MPVKALQNKTFLITAGPTREYLDPVRYITNGSSGRTGYMLSKNARAMGAEVFLISGPVDLPVPAGVKITRVNTAIQMRAAVRKFSAKSDVMIFSAAVCDYRPARTHERKLKSVAGRMTVGLVKNPDIMKEAGLKKGRRMVVGFALETDNMLENAKKKLRDKNADMMVANPVSNIESPNGRAVMVFRDGRTKAVRKTGKAALAAAIIREIAGLVKNGG